MTEHRPADARSAAPNGPERTLEAQTAAFLHPDQAWPVRAIRRGGAVRPLPPHPRSLADLTFEAGGGRFGIDAFMDRRRTAGLLVLKHGRIALERYGLGAGPQSLWACMAVTTAITGTLAGAALHDGAIGGLDDPCDLYLPQMLGSAYEGVTIRNLLRMGSGAAWREADDGEGRGDIRRLGRALVRGRPGGILELMARLPRALPQGSLFNYSTGESCLLAAVIIAATGRPLADYCAETIWGPAGMEADGGWQLESPDGLELGGLGVSAGLRDLGRFGLLVLEDGAAFSGRRVLPAGWRDLAGQPDSAATAFGRLLPGSAAGFGYHWWALPGAPFADGLHAGAFLALGAHGQRLYVNPPEGLVVVIQSAWDQAQDAEAELETVMLLRAVVRALRPDPAA